MTTSIAAPVPGSNTEPESGQAPPTDRSARAALIVFGALLVVAVPVVLFVLGDYHWFFRDDFSFLTGREADSLHDLFEPHNAHWSTVPVLAFRALYAVFGLRSYVPYQATVLLLHLSACALLRVIMRRVGVSPWIATAAAGAFVFFGPGQQNIIWAFQIGFTGSLVFGLVQLVLADHDGPIDKRDIVGVLFGVLSLMSSSVGIVMAIVVGTAAFGRRGWKAALVHVSPLAAAYVVYKVVENPNLASRFGRPTVGVLFRWVRSGEIGVFMGLGHFSLVAILLGVVFVAGLVLAWSRASLADLRRYAALPAAMFVGGILFSAFSGYGRWFNGPEFARSSRYVHIGTALALPAIAVAADAIARRWRVLTVPLIVLLLLAVPWNVDAFEHGVFGPQYMAQRKEVLTNVVRLPAAGDVPRDVRPIPDRYLGRDLNIGWLLDAVQDGKLEPASGPMSPELVNEMRIRLGVSQGDVGFPSPCETVDGPLDLNPALGTVIGFGKPLTIETHDGKQATSERVAFDPADGHSLTIEIESLHLRIRPAFGQPSLTTCEMLTGPPTGSP